MDFEDLMSKKIGIVGSWEKDVLISTIVPLGEAGALDRVLFQGRPPRDAWVGFQDEIFG